MTTTIGFQKQQGEKEGHGIKILRHQLSVEDLIHRTEE